MLDAKSGFAALGSSSSPAAAQRERQVVVVEILHVWRKISTRHAWQVLLAKEAIGAEMTCQQTSEAALM